MSIAEKFNIPPALFETIKKMNAEETEYQMKVKALMKKRGFTSIGQMSPEEKKDFFNTLDAMHKAKNEEVELEESVDEKKIRKDLDSGMSHDAVIGKHANKKLSNTDAIRKVIQKHAWEKRMKKEEVELDEAIPKSTGHALVHSSSKKIIAKGNKAEMMKKMKELNAKEKNSHHLGMTNRGKVGDTFGEEVELEEGYEKVVLDFLDKKGFDSPNFKNGNLYVSKRELAGVKKALQNPTGFNAKDLKVIAEEVELDEGKSGTGYELYHKDFSSAMAHAYDFAKKKYNIEIDPTEIDRNVAMGPKKPSSGKANAYRLLDKTGKKAIQVQVANLDNKRYELNMYKEDLDEERDPPFTPDKPKKNPGVVPGKHGVGPSVAKHLAKMAMKKQQEKKPMKKEEKYVNPGLEKLAAQKKKTMKKEDLEEGMSSAQVAKLRQEYEKIDKIDPTSDNYKKLTAMLDKLDTKTLQQLAGAKIKFVSGLAQNRIVRRMNEEQELTESHFKVGQRVECIASGMKGTVVKVDKPEVGKYYTVKQDSGKMMKYAPDELKALSTNEEVEELDEEETKEFMVKFEKQGKVSVKNYTGKSELDVRSKAKVDAKRMGMTVASVRLKEEVEEAVDPQKSMKRAGLSVARAKEVMRHRKEIGTIRKKREALKSSFDPTATVLEAYKKGKMKKEATAKDNQKDFKSGDKLSGKTEPIEINPELKEQKT